MTDPVVPTPAEAVIPPTVDTPAAPDKPAEETPKTMEQIQDEIVPDDKPKETVGLDKFLTEKKARKDAEKRIKELEDSIKDGATPSEVNATLAEISAEYTDVDPKFLQKLANAIRAQVEKDAEAKISDRLKPLEAKDKEAKIDAAFTKHFNAAMETMPEFKDIVNAAVIKSLSLDPKNANKTFKQIIEDTYGNALTGKRTIETTTPGGGKDAETLDFAKARKDGTYFDQVMANPALKKEYNERMLKEGL